MPEAVIVQLSIGRPDLLNFVAGSNALRLDDLRCGAQDAGKVDQGGLEALDSVAGEATAHCLQGRFMRLVRTFQQHGRDEANTVAADPPEAQ